MQNLKDFLSGKGPYIVFVGGVFILLAGFFYLNFNEDDMQEEVFLPWEEESTEQTEEDVVEVNVMIDIKGEVISPGIYQMFEEDRVHDAVMKAGGFTSEANESMINLAERCYDEMVIYVPSVNEDEEPIFSATTTTSNSAGKEGGVLINQVDAQALTVLPGIGPAKAEAIVSYRDENGPFKTEEDITQVPGIGEKTLEAIRDQIIIK
ncbi:helix-hairpin-helix domain-containing protein [Salipaludibacillus daqingensis]|uniref:helix-hairpin-helix domain-containing protein n=1 Tax=Salipaludibacillus daqingensis TaxID=3041001 RepID=UPI0024732866|nr:helix-hairpin-helix domain-containing protein [Salipaludibacillus daqingensis]